MTASGLLGIIAGSDTSGLWEVRCRSPRTGRIDAREWFALADHEQCSRFIRQQAPTLDVYVGAALRTRREGGKSAISRVWCLWADVDTDASRERLEAFSPAPSLVVESGTGSNVHAWWALNAPLPPVWVERANRRLAYHLGADMKATDAARILRPPGTLNHKSDPPALVTTELCVPGWEHEQVRADFLLPVAAIVGGLADPPGRAPRQQPMPTRIASDDLLAISSDAYYAALTGWEPSLTTHVHCPFWKHNSNPAMMLYEGGTWYCFACAEGGSIFEFGAKLWGYVLPVRGEAFKELRERLLHAI